MKKVTLSVFLLLFYFIGFDAKSTEQIKEVVTIGGNDFSFYGYPLEGLLSDEEFREVFQLNTLCTAAWRGYQGVWAISDKQLYLDYLKRNPCDMPDVSNGVFERSKLFRDLKDTRGLYKAEWFSGEIVIPISESRRIVGKMTKNGYPYYERQVIVYLIDRGNVINRKIEYREA